MPKFLFFPSKQPPPAQDYLLDLYPGATVGCSFRKLRGAYSGPCLRVRRTSDNGELDIGFTGDVVDTAALVAFVGASSGYIVTWYDQGLEGNDMYLTGSQAPRLVDSGALDTAGGFPCLRYESNAERGLRTSTISGLRNKNNCSAFTCLQIVTGDVAIVVAPDGSSTPYAGAIGGNGASSSTMGSPAYGVNGDASVVGLNRSQLYDGLVDDVGVGILSTTEINAGQRNYDYVVTFNYSNATLRPSASALLEHIFYDETQTANEVAIRNNMNAFYGAF